MKIIETDNFAGDYPDEKFLSLTDSEGNTRPFVTTPNFAEGIAAELNVGRAYNRFYRVVEDNYTLQPGFEP